MTTITREQFFDFIRTNKDKECAISKATQHYLNYFDKYQSTRKKGGWNWAAFFPLGVALLYPSNLSVLFCGFWFFYRKMYIYVILIPVITIILNIFLVIISQLHIELNYLLENESMYKINYKLCINMICKIILFILSARYCDYIYLRHASKKVLENKIKGGISKFSPIIFLFIYISSAFVTNKYIALYILNCPHKFDSSINYFIYIFINSYNAF